MTHRLRIALALVPALVAGTLPAYAQQAAGKSAALSVSYVRYWRAPATTLVEGLVQVDFAALAGATAEQPPRVDFEVRDDAGRTLHSETWNVNVDPALAASGRSGQVTTPFTVALAAGKYTVAVRLSHGSMVDSMRVPVEGYAAVPALSDLLASPQIRISNDTGPLAPSEMRRGRYVVERAPRVRLTPDDPRLAYYIELYPGSATKSPEQVGFDVRSADGTRTLLHTEQAAQVAADGLPLVGRLELAGLPPGDYDLVVKLQRGATPVERTAPFTMAPLSAEPVVVSAPVPTARAGAGTDSAMIARYLSPLVMPDSALKRLVDALVMAPPGPPLPKLLKTVGPDPQRQIIAQYFARAQQVAGSPGKNALLEEYMSRLAEVDRLYSERDTHRSGVHTDRGRIFMKYGAPDDKTSLEMENRHNVELWKYQRRRNLRFLFLDTTGFGHLALIATTDPNEPSLPDWQQRVDDSVARTFLQP